MIPRETKTISDSIEVVWDGEIVVVVEKPPGLSTQAPGAADSLEVRLRAQFRDRSDYLAFPHRLDRPVGGLILVALRKRAARLLGQQFMARRIEKEYLAQLAGHLESAPTVWSDTLRKVPGEARAEVVDPQHPEGQLAETGVELVGYDAAENCSWVRFRPVTGRMHQLRVQASSRGLPIVGDTLYGGPPLEGNDGPIQLRSHSIRFFDPRDSRPVTVTASDRWTQPIRSDAR